MVNLFYDLKLAMTPFKEFSSISSVAKVEFLIRSGNYLSP